MRLLVIDVGDVLVATRPGRQYAVLAKLASLSIEEVIYRFESSDLAAEFDRGLLSIKEFSESVNDLLGCRFEITTVEQAWRAVVGTVDTEMIRAVLPLARQRRLLLASNTDAIHWPLVRRRLAIAGLTAPSVLSFQLGLAKPSKEFFKAITSGYINLPGPFGYIDDQHSNVQAAKEAGLSAIVHTTAVSSAKWIQDSFPIKK